jgi:hypothetical protein
MAENINFIPANELPEAVGDEIEVLCVENGQMKRKTGSLGGKGLVVYMTAENVVPSSETEFTYTANFDEIAETIHNGGDVWVDMQGVTGIYARGKIITAIYMGGSLVLTAYAMGAYYSFTCTNGTWTPPVE